MELKSSSGSVSLPARTLRPSPTPDEARELARDVYCFAYPDSPGAERESN
jgi:hypothetical protein